MAYGNLSSVKWSMGCAKKKKSRTGKKKVYHVKGLEKSNSDFGYSITQPRNNCGPDGKLA